MTVETNLEREFKFDVDPDFDPPDLRPLVGRTERLPEQHLRTTYYDTADHRLWARGITLRHRMEGEGDGAGGEVGKWTLKLPLAPWVGDADGMARDELTWKGMPDRIPDDARAIVAGLVRRAPLAPVVVLATERRRLLLHGGTEGDAAGPGQPWAEIDDDLVTVASGGREGLRFRQIELELLGEPGPGAVDTVLDELGGAGAAPGGASKFALAAGLAGADADPPPSVPAAGGMGTVVKGILAGDLGALLDWDFRLRIPDGDGDEAGVDVEAVHQARVATRRMRSDLQTLGPVLDPVWLRHVRSDLKWVARLLGRLRDEDVLVERVRAHGDGGTDAEAVEEIVRLLRSDRHLGATELCEALTSDRYLDVLERLNAAVEAPPLVSPTGEHPGDVEVGPTLDSVLTAHGRVLQAQVDDLAAEPTDADLHQVRIAAKRLRYAAEAVEPYVGKRARRAARSARRLQSVLGNLNDAAIASRSLRELASHPSVTPAVAFVAGRIAGRAEGEVARLRRQWQKPARKLLRS